eukprot:1291251-Rhodomonas_salina.1
MVTWVPPVVPGVASAAKSKAGDPMPAGKRKHVRAITCAQQAESKSTEASARTGSGLDDSGERCKSYMKRLFQTTPLGRNLLCCVSKLLPRGAMWHRVMAHAGGSDLKLFPFARTIHNHTHYHTKKQKNPTAEPAPAHILRVKTQSPFSANRRNIMIDRERRLGEVVGGCTALAQHKL